MLKNKQILIMGIRNKWSIAYGAAKSAFNNGAKLIFTFRGEENRSKIEELISEFNGVAYECDASNDEQLDNLFKTIKANHGKLDGILHSIANAHTEDLRNPFIQTSKEGFCHANDVSAYSFVATCRLAKENDVLNENSSIVALTYYLSLIHI